MAARLLAAARNAIREFRADYARAGRLAEHGANLKRTFKLLPDTGAAAPAMPPPVKEDVPLGRPLHEAWPAAVRIV
jgi:hypothetical protein